MHPWAIIHHSAKASHLVARKNRMKRGNNAFIDSDQNFAMVSEVNNGDTNSKGQIFDFGLFS
jgi:hypothetical protein